MKPKSKSITLLIWLFLGMFGGHRFYVGKWKSGLVYIVLYALGMSSVSKNSGVASLCLTAWGIFWFVDLFLILLNRFTDKYGRLLVTSRTQQYVPQTQNIPRAPQYTPQTQNIPQTQQYVPQTQNVPRAPQYVSQMQNAPQTAQTVPQSRNTTPGVYAYSGTEPFIFISYAHRDSAKVLPIIAKLQADGYLIWFDEGIDPGTEWDANIAAHVRQCGLMLAFLSSSYLNSNNCKDELNFARDLDKNRILIYLEDIVLPDGMAMRLNRLQAIHQYRYQNQNDFYQKLYDSPDMQAMRTGAGQ